MDNRFHWHKKKTLPHQREHEEKERKKANKNEDEKIQARAMETSK